MTSRFALPVVAIAAALCPLAPLAWSQAKGELRARELFYTPPPDSNGGAASASTTTSRTPATSGNKQTATKQTASKDTATKQTAKATGTTGSSVPTERVAAEKQTSSVVPLGLRYAVLKRDEASRFSEVNPDATFHTGDRIRLQVEANTSGYLYIVMQGTSGNWRLLFPSTEVSGGSNVIRRGDTRLIPPGDRGQFLFDEQAGVEKLFLVLSRQPEPDLDKLIYSIGGNKNGSDAAGERTLMAQTTVSDDVIARLRRQVLARDLVFEKVDGGSGANLENAAYVVNKSGAPDARLVVDVKLTHK